MPWFRNQIYDGRISAWTRQMNQATSDVAIITAHGEDAVINAFWPDGGYALVYFCPHGNDLGDPGLAEFRNYGVQYDPNEIQHSPNLKQNYELKKYQGKHSHNSETYDNIYGLPDADGPDIITISNSNNLFLNLFSAEGVFLSTLIGKLFDANYRYRTFHCAFCRGAATVGRNTVTVPKAY